MDEAARLLRETHKKVTDIATQLHINSVSHFTTDFKKAYGMTPTQYRKHCRLSPEEEDGT